MPFIPAIIGVASAVAGGISASKARKKAQTQQDQAFAMQQDLLGQQKKGAELAYGYAQDYLPSGRGLLDSAANFWKPIVTGDRSAISSFLSPEVNQYNRALDSTARGLLTSGPRGSMLDKYTSLMFQKQGDLSNMFFNARRQGVGALTDLGSIFTNAGLSALGTAGGTAGSAANTLTGVQTLAYQQKQDAAAGMQQAGQVLGTLLPMLFRSSTWGKGANSNSSGSSTASMDWSKFLGSFGF